MVGTELFEATLYLHPNAAAANLERTDVTQLQCQAGNPTSPAPQPKAPSSLLLSITVEELGQALGKRKSLQPQLLGASELNAGNSTTDSF